MHYIFDELFSISLIIWIKCNLGYFLFTGNSDLQVGYYFSNCVNNVTSFPVIISI